MRLGYTKIYSPVGWDGFWFAPPAKGRWSQCWTSWIVTVVDFC